MALFFNVEKISYAHPIPGKEPHPAIKNVSFSIEEGEYVAIVGSNGSGKTTLARHLNALHVPDSGQVLIKGMNTLDLHNHLKIHQQVGMVFQHPQEQLVATTIEEDVAFGPENLGLETSEIRSRVQQALQAVGLWEIRERSPQHLSAGQMQRVALAGIIAMQPACVIFDEATAMLDPIGRRDIHLSIKSLRQRGITVITITHFMNEAVQADRVLAMHQGELVFDGKPDELFANTILLEKIRLTQPRVTTIANLLKPWIPTLNNPLNVLQFNQQLQENGNHFQFPSENLINNHEVSPKIIKGENLSFSYLFGSPLAYQALHTVNFDVPENTIMGLIGSTGSGKSTLLQHINGLYQAQSGNLTVGPYQVNPDQDIQQLRRYVGIVFQNPNYQLFEQYVGDEIAYGLKLQGLKGWELRERVHNAMNRVGLDFDTFKDRLTFTLSGGERRKVALASTIALDPQILLLDEPTAGLDPSSRLEVREQISDLNRNGKTIILSSHQMEDIANLSEEVLLLNKGHSITQEKTARLLSNQTLLNKYQMQRPIAAILADLLRNKGYRLPKQIVTTKQLVQLFITGAENRG